LEIADFLEASGINLEATEQPINTRTVEGRMFFTILSAVAEFEHSLMVNRTKNGLAAARARGRSAGRKPKLTDRQVTKIRAEYTAGGVTGNRSRMTAR
jgi:DNA invertase Pin-like site-specific DNA recombinase